jgi:hypothetical protein
MADNLQRPMIFLKVESGYKQDGWLNLIMGKSAWVECQDVEMVDYAFAQVTKKLSEIGNMSISVALPPPTPSTPSKQQSQDQVVSMLNSVLTQLGDIKKEIGELRQEVKQLKGKGQ